jgi:hypothetical protein
MILVNQPFCPPAHGKNLGLAYNSFMARLRPGDWALFLDDDAMLTVSHWYEIVEGAIAQDPAAGFFCACSNRLFWDDWQLAKMGEDVRDSDDIRLHRDYGADRVKQFGSQIVPINSTKPMSGVCFAVSQKTWTRVKFREGLFGVDNAFHIDCIVAKLDCYLIPGLYVYHWRGGRKNTEQKTRLPADTHNPLWCDWDGKGVCPRCGVEIGTVGAL